MTFKVTLALKVILFIKKDKCKKAQQYSTVGKRFQKKNQTAYHLLLFLFSITYFYSPIDLKNYLFYNK